MTSQSTITGVIVVNGFFTTNRGYQMSSKDLPARAGQVFEDVQKILAERDTLFDANRKLESAIALLTQRVMQYTNTIKDLSHERDYYMRYCTEIRTQLNNIQIVINEAVVASKGAAYRPNNPVAVPERPALTQGQEHEVLSELAKRLAPEPYVQPDSHFEERGRGYMDRGS